MPKQIVVKGSSHRGGRSAECKWGLGGFSPPAGRRVAPLAKLIKQGWVPLGYNAELRAVPQTEIGCLWQAGRFAQRWKLPRQINGFPQWGRLYRF